MVGVLSKQIIDGTKGTLDETGYLALFLSLGICAIFAFFFTLPFPTRSYPEKITYMFKWPKMGRRRQANET